MRTGEIAKLVGVSDRTISDWWHRFGDFFSSQTGSQRNYTSNDVEIFTTIAKLSHEGVGLDEIESRLQSGERHSPDSLVGSGLITEYVPKESVTALIDSAQIAAERDRLFKMVEDLTRQLEKRDEENKTLTHQLIILNREIGVLEGRLQGYQQDKKKKK